MIEVRAYRNGRVESGIAAEDISEIVGTPDTLLWVDVADPTDEDMVCLQEEFALHPLALEDARKHGQRPKLERYPTHAFVVAYSATLAEVDLFVGPTWVVSVRGRNDEGEIWEAKTARHRFERSGPLEATAGYLLYAILDEIVDGYFDRTDQTEDRLEALEDRIFATTAPDERGMQEDLYAIRRELVSFRRRVMPMRDVVMSLLRRDIPWIDDFALTQMQDVLDHVLREIDVIDSQRELMGNAVDAHLAIISNRMNQVMKKMTSYGAIILGSTLIAGIYGMNFKHMPELEWQYGYAFALSSMAALTLTLTWYFRRRDWL